MKKTFLLSVLILLAIPLVTKAADYSAEAKARVAVAMASVKLPPAAKMDCGCDGPPCTCGANCQCAFVNKVVKPAKSVPVAQTYYYVPPVQTYYYYVPQQTFFPMMGGCAGGCCGR